MLSPNGQRVVKLLGGSKGRKIPGVTVVVDILDVATDGDSLALVNALVDGVASEGVDGGLVVGQSLVTARLESGGVAAAVDIEVVDRSEKSVGVLASAAIININYTEVRLVHTETMAKRRTVSFDVFVGRDPVLLELAENRGGDVGVSLARLTKLASKGACLDES